MVENDFDFAKLVRGWYEVVPYLTPAENTRKKAARLDGFSGQEGLALLASFGTIDNRQRAKADLCSLSTSSEHEAAEGVGGLAIGGEAD